MFAVVGKGIFDKERLLEFLTKNGLINPFEFVREAERRGRVDCGIFKILMIR